MHTTESRLLSDWKIHCLQASPCIFQPGNFTDFGSEGFMANDPVGCLCQSCSVTGCPCHLSCVGCVSSYGGPTGDGRVAETQCS